MARPRPEKKREPQAPADTKVLPIELRVGDRLADETGALDTTSASRAPDAVCSEAIDSSTERAGISGRALSRTSTENSGEPVLPYAIR